MRPEDVKLKEGLPISFLEHVDVYGSAEAAIEAMIKRCLAGHDWVCAALFDQIEYYIREMMSEANQNVRYPVIVMLYELQEPFSEVADWIEHEWEKLSSKYGLEESEVGGETTYRLKGISEAKQKAMLNKIAKELIKRFEKLMYEHFGERYKKIYAIRNKVRTEASASQPLTPLEEIVGESEVGEVGGVGGVSGVSSIKKEVSEQRKKELQEEIKKLKELVKILENELKNEVEKI